MQSRIIQSLFDIANENKIHLEKTQTDTEHNTLDYIVYFRKDFPVIYSINKFATGERTDENNQPLQNPNKRKWGFLIFDPFSCKLEDYYGKRHLFYDPETKFHYRFNFMSEVTPVTFKNKYALRNRMRGVIEDDEIVKLPFVYEFMRTDRTLSKILQYENS